MKEDTAPFTVTVKAWVLDHNGAEIKQDVLQADDPKARAAFSKYAKKIKQTFKKFAGGNFTINPIDTIQAEKEKFTKKTGLNLKIEMVLKHRAAGESVTLPFKEMNEM